VPVGRPRDSGTLMRVCMPQLSSFLTQILGCPSTRGSRAMHSNADPSRSLCASGMRHARSRDMDNVAAAWRREAARRGGLTGCAGGVAGGADVVSVSEFDSDADLAERHAAVAGAAAAARRPGRVERQDSANYQPRPPAMTERQDSAQNLQARTARVRPLRVLACRLWTACPPLAGLPLTGNQPAAMTQTRSSQTCCSSTSSRAVHHRGTASCERQAHGVCILRPLASGRPV